MKRKNVDLLAKYDVPENNEEPLTIEEFQLGIKGVDYDNTDSMFYLYKFLVRASLGQPGLYNQYAAVIKADALSKGHVDKDVDYSLILNKLMYITPNAAESDIVNYINAVYHNKEHADKVSVLPLMCGSGKSTAITLLVKETIDRVEKAQKKLEQAIHDAKENEDESEEITVEGVTEQDFDGLLIVTDSKERLQKIWKPDPENKNFRKKDREFIEKHDINCGKWINIITEENSYDEARQHKAPVLCITTQRYFSWYIDEIRDHLSWGEGECRHRRPLIIFDEQPYLNETRDISVKTINDIDTALRCYLDETIDTEKKLWCFDQWDKFRARFFELLKHYEYDFDRLDTLFYQPKEHGITENDEVFFGFIEAEKQRKKIRAKDNEAYKDLLSIRQFMNSWGVFSHRDTSTGEYENKFTVFIDNRSKVTNLGAKVIVLDGTGNVSPIYCDQDYVHVHSGVSFLRLLSYLNIVLCDFPTSKQDFRIPYNNIAKTVKAYLKEQGHEQKDVIFFTYKGKENGFQATVNGKKIKNVAHFGDIKGKNEFTDNTVFAHVGLFRLQPVQYLVHVLGRNPELLHDLAEREPESMYARIQEIYETEEYLSFMYDHILADIDQCMFRSAIRNSDNLQPVTYYLFYKQSSYPMLRSRIEGRYKSKLGADITPVEEKTIWDIAKAGTRETILWIKLKEWDGAPMKIGNFLDQLQMNTNSYYTALRRSPKLTEYIEKLKQNAKDMGYPGGWIAKKPVQG